jgi:uncharacterized protein YdeI (YjbR/CyaY-like superfamily)
MGTKSPEVDRYIADAAPFARPILEKIRKAYHKADPEIVETIKWSVPHFEHKGIVGNMAAFKSHVSFGFWKAGLMSDRHGLLTNKTPAGSRVSEVSELPSEKVLVETIREAVRLNDEGVKSAPRPKKAPAPLEIPEELTAALRKNRKARAVFEGFSPGAQREYAMWIAEAKQEATRQKRLAQAIEWISEGKQRNWKYMK